MSKKCHKLEPGEAMMRQVNAISLLNERGCNRSLIAVVVGVSFDTVTDMVEITEVQERREVYQQYIMAIVMEEAARWKARKGQYARMLDCLEYLWVRGLPYPSLRSVASKFKMGGTASGHLQHMMSRGDVHAKRRRYRSQFIVRYYPEGWERYWEYCKHDGGLIDS